MLTRGFTTRPFFLISRITALVVAAAATCWVDIPSRSCLVVGNILPPLGLRAQFGDLSAVATGEIEWPTSLLVLPAPVVFFAMGTAHLSVCADRASLRRFVGLVTII